MSSRHAGYHLYERSPGDASRPLPGGSRLRRPETTDLYRIVATHLETMLADARDRSPHGFGLPRHVELDWYPSSVATAAVEAARVHVDASAELQAVIKEALRRCVG